MKRLSTIEKTAYTIGDSDIFTYYYKIKGKPEGDGLSSIQSSIDRELKGTGLIGVIEYGPNPDLISVHVGVKTPRSLKETLSKLRDTIEERLDEEEFVTHPEGVDTHMDRFLHKF